MALDTWRTPSISRPMRSSMSLMVSASRSNSSPPAGQAHPLRRGRRPRSPPRSARCWRQHAAEQAAAPASAPSARQPARSAARHSRASRQQGAQLRRTRRTSRPTSRRKPPGRSKRCTPGERSGCRRAPPAARYQLSGARHVRRPALQIAGDPLLLGVGQQIDRVVVDILRQPVVDRHDQRRQPAFLPALGQALRVGPDRRLDLPVEQARRRVPEEHGQRQPRSARTAARRRPRSGRRPSAGTGGAPDRMTARVRKVFRRGQGRSGGGASSRRLGPQHVAGAADRVDQRRSGTACRSSAAAARRARRSRWSAGRNGSPTRLPAAWCGSPPGRRGASGIPAAGTRAAAGRSSGRRRAPARDSRSISRSPTGSLRLRPVAACAAPRQRLDPRQQLGEGERLGQVVVAARLEAAHPVVHLRPSRRGTAPGRCSPGRAASPARAARRCRPAACGRG